MKKNIIIIFMLLLTTVNSRATPGPGKKYVEKLLGVNQNYYFCYVSQKSQPGSHYVFYDSTMVCKYEIETGKKTASILLRVVEYSCHPDFLVWEHHNEFINDTLNLHQYLIENDALNLYPSAFFYESTIHAGENGIVVTLKNGDQKTLLTVPEMENLSKSGCLQDMRYIECYESEAYLFLLIREGDFCCIDGDYFQYILSFNRDSILQKLQSTDIDNTPPDDVLYVEVPQNYPNPFNPSTTIHYSLKAESAIELTIYNIRGQVIKLLERGIKSAGNYTIVWNGIDNDGNPVPSGVYFCSLKVNDDSVLTRRMIVLR